MQKIEFTNERMILQQALELLGSAAGAAGEANQPDDPRPAAEAGGDPEEPSRDEAVS
jgi:hypothetical protein